MSAKDDLLSDLARQDASGGVLRLHSALISAGLQFKGPRNSRTLLYFFRCEGREVGVAALRGSPALLSFPSSFWRGRAGLAVAMEKASLYRIETEGFVSSSQYSAGQIRISSASVDLLLSIVADTIIPEAKSAGCNAT